MGFWKLLEVASDPVLQVLLISGLGALMATQCFNNLLSEEFRKTLNKVIYIVFTPALVFASFAKSVSLQDMISWWFMPINIVLTFIIGGILGWVIVKVLKPNLKLEGLIIAACSTGNLGNLPIVIIPAICDEKEGPFSRHKSCRSTALSYSSFSMAVSGIIVWTYTYQSMRISSMKFKALEAAADMNKKPNRDVDATAETHLLMGKHTENTLREDAENQIVVDQDSSSIIKGNDSLLQRLKQILCTIVEELMSPPNIAIILGFLFGGITWLKNLIIGDSAPLRVIQDTIQLLGDGAIPCVTLLLGGNLTKGMKSSSVKPSILIGILLSRLIMLPAIGMIIVKVVANFGFLPEDPLFHYVLVMQYAMPPAMNISTMAQLFDVGQEESSVILLWAYGVATITLTAWSTFLMWMWS